MASSSSNMAGADSVSTPNPAAPTITREYFEEQEIYKIYKGYLCSAVDAKDDDLENFYQLCVRFGYIPNLETVNWIIKETNIIDVTRRLEFPVYPFVQEFQYDFHVARDTNQPRMLVGHVPSDHGRRPLYAGWLPATGDDLKANIKFYSKPYANEHGSGELDIHDETRNQIEWEEPFEQIFKLSKYEPTHESALIQDSILLSIAKIVARFPGLAKPVNVNNLAHDVMGQAFIERLLVPREDS
ncbi:hypothetical protein KCU67_g4470, partial [Aureobasidium melanogenum]